MLQKIRYRLVYNRKNKLDKYGRGLVQIECLLNRKRIFFTTRVYLKPDEWDNGYVVNNPHAIQLNEMLYKSIMDMEKIELDFIRRGVRPTLAQMKNAILHHINSGAKFEDFTNEIVNNSVYRGESTRASYQTLIKHVNNFQKNVTLQDIDLDFLNRFAEWSKNQGMSQSTISGRLKNLRAIINEAIARKLLNLEDDPFRHFKIKKIKQRQETLTMDEVNRLMSARLTGRQGYIRDVFCFACLCGLRYSDLKSLTDADFCTIKGKRWIVKQTQKTGETARIPIEVVFRGKAMALLNKYKSIKSFAKIGNNASANRTLKEVFKKVGILKDGHFHLARHSFITLCIEEGIPITTVQMMASHSKIETTRGYAKLGISTIQNDVNKIFGKKKSK